MKVLFIDYIIYFTNIVLLRVFKVYYLVFKLKTVLNGKPTCLPNKSTIWTPVVVVVVVLSCPYAQVDCQVQFLTLKAYSNVTQIY